MFRNIWLIFAALGTLFVCTLGSVAAQAADDPSANPPAAPRLLGTLGERGLLLRTEVVQKELELTDEQKVSIKKLQDKAGDVLFRLQRPSLDEFRAKLRELRKDQEEQVAKILNNNQKARLKQIFLQYDGALGLADKEVAESLKLSDDQVKQIKKLTENFRNETRRAIQPAAGARDPASVSAALANIRKEANEKIMAVLKDEQETAFEKLQGAKMDLPVFSFPGTGQPGGGN